MDSGAARKWRTATGPGGRDPCRRQANGKPVCVCTPALGCISRVPSLPSSSLAVLSVEAGDCIWGREKVCGKGDLIPFPIGKRPTTVSEDRASLLATSTWYACMRAAADSLLHLWCHPYSTHTRFAKKAAERFDRIDESMNRSEGDTTPTR